MNRTSVAALAILLAAGTPCTFAASNVDLAVTGLITPSACSPTLDQEGVIDFGKIPARDLNSEDFTPLPVNALALGIDCEAATLFALRFIDNRANSNPTAPHGFGLGLINGSERLGVFHTMLHSPLADNAAITQLQSLNDGQSWVPVDANVMVPPLRLVAFGDRSSGVWAPISIKALRATIDVKTFIAPAQGLTLDREVPLDGSATLNLIYL
jgi:type 1 fimbria pilin